MKPEKKGREQITLEEARELLITYSTPIREIEVCSILECSGRILAEEIRAAFDNPPFDRSPIDGYACKSEDLKTASTECPAVLQVLGEIDAGMAIQYEVKRGQAVRIMTGAPIPNGADCCVYQENTDYGEEQVKVFNSCKAYENYCFRGEDTKKGTIILKEGIKLSYSEAGILAGLGFSKVKVYRRVKVAVFATGDELEEPGKPLSYGRIYDNNLYFLAVRLKEFGAEPVILKRVSDCAKKMAEELKKVAGQVDFIITTGGVSVGKKDIMHEALNLAGAKRLFWKIRMKPGMPTIGSILEEIPVLSLSGNPFGALADCELLARPMLEIIGRDDSLSLKIVQAVLSQGFKKASPSRRFLRGTYKNGKVTIPKVSKHASGILSSMAGCNCLLDIPAGTEKIEKDGIVQVLLL